MYHTHILGNQDRSILEIYSERPLTIDSSELNGTLTIMVGTEVLTLLLGQSTLQEKDNSVSCPEIRQSKVGDKSWVVSDAQLETS